MSLATRCTSCGTVFRVVQDQLKVSEGWVRCGRCDAVFNALEGLFDLGRDAPAELGRAPAQPLAATARRRRRPSRRAADAARRPPRRAATATTKGHSSSFPSTAPAALGDLLADPIDAHLFGQRKRRKRAEAGRPRSTSATGSSSPTPASTPTCSPRTPRRRHRAVELPASDAGDLPLESAHGSPTSCAAPSGSARWRSGPVRSRSALRARSRSLLLLAAGRPSLPRHRRRPLAGARARPGRLVQARRLHARGAAPDRRGAGRQHRAHPRDRPRRLRPLGHAARAAARCRSPCRRST